MKFDGKTWKWAAKVNRDFYRLTLGLAKRNQLKWHKAEALAASRLVLLREQNKTRVEKGMCCFVCGAGVHGFTRTGKFELSDNHTEDCELAKALVSEQSEEELGDDND